MALKRRSGSSLYERASGSMLLPDINLFAKLCGVTSLGEVLLPSEVRVKGGNGALHKTLRDLCDGKPISANRMTKLSSAIIEHLLPDDEALREDVLRQSLKAIASNSPARKVSREVVSLELWYQLYLSIPEARSPQTKQHLYSLLAASQATLREVEKDGLGYLAERCEAADDQIWRPWFEYLARRLHGQNSIPEDVCLALSVMGVLGLALVWVAEGARNQDLDEKGQQVLVKNAIELLFAHADGRANPRMSVAYILEYARQEAKCITRIEFIHKAFGTSGTRVREAQKFLSGAEIPSHAQTMNALNVGIDMDSDDRRAWRMFVMVAQFIARSSRKLEELAGVSSFDVCQLYRNYFVALQAILEQRSMPARASDQDR